MSSGPKVINHPGYNSWRAQVRGLAEGYLKTQMPLEHKRFTMLVTRDRGMYRRARVTSEGV